MAEESGTGGKNNTESEINGQKAIEELFTRLSKAKAREDELEKERLERQIRQTEELKEQEKKIEKITKAKKDLNDVSEVMKALLKEQLELEAELKGATEERKAELTEELETNRDILNGLQLNYSEQEQILETLKEQNKEYKKTEKQIEKIRMEMLSDALKKDFKELAGKIPVIGDSVSKAFDFSKKTDNMGRDFGKIGAKIKEIFPDSKWAGKIGDAFGKVGGRMQNFAKGLSYGTLIVLGFLKKIFDMSLEINNLSKELGRATGFGDKFNNEIRRMGLYGAMSGVGFKESAVALKSLTEGMSSFNPSAEETNMHVGMTVARLQKLGVSSSSAVKSIDHMQRAMGMSAKQAANATAQIARMGKEIGITGTKMMEQFNAASARLAIYGKNNIKVFKGLAAAAKASGIEMQSLINISKGFDQFDTAAESASKLNAVLGTQLSTIDLMNASDEERIIMIKQQVQASVGNFDSLDKFTKMYVAQALGVSDVAEAQRLLNMSTAEYQKYQQGQQEQANIQKELAEATAELVPLMDQLKMAGIQLFLAFEPLIVGFTAIIQIIGMAFTKIGSLFGPMEKASNIATILKTVFIALAAGVLVFVGVISWPVGLVIALVAALGALWDIFHKDGSPMLYEMFDFIAGAVKRMAMAFAWPITMVHGLAEGFKSMFGAMHEKEATQSFDIAAMAKLDTTKIADGLGKIKSAVMDLGSIKMDGFLALRTDGSSTSMLMGSESVIKNLSEGKLTVDVKMPEFKMPDISVKVFIGDRELRDIIRTETKAVMGGIG